MGEVPPGPLLSPDVQGHDCFELEIQGSIQKGNSQVLWGFILPLLMFLKCSGTWEGNRTLSIPGLRVPLTSTLPLPPPASVKASPDLSPPSSALLPPTGKGSRDHTASRLPRFLLPGANYGTTLDKSQHML